MRQYAETGTALLIALAVEAGEKARINGHRLRQWVRDGQRRLLADCAGCGLYAVADTSDNRDDEGPIYGSTTTARCQGVPHGKPSSAARIMPGVQPDREAA